MPCPWGPIFTSQVALLFLVKGPFHHETLWRLWFQSAAGLLPADAVAAALCGGNSDSSSSMTQQRQVLQACRNVALLQQAPAATGTPAADSAGRNGRALLAGSLAAADPAAGSPAAAPGRHASSATSAGGIPSSDSSGSGSGTSHSSSDGSGSVLEQQALFDVYVHPHPSFSGEPSMGFRARKVVSASAVLCMCSGAQLLLSATHSPLPTLRRAATCLAAVLQATRQAACSMAGSCRRRSEWSRSGDSTAWWMQVRVM